MEVGKNHDNAPVTKYTTCKRDQCEELRATLSKRNQDLVIRERDEQIKIKEELAKQEQKGVMLIVKCFGY